MAQYTEIQGKSMDMKVMQNRREDKKAFKKMIFFIVLCGVLGFFVGLFSAKTEDGVLKLAEILKIGVDAAAPYGNVFFGTVTWIVCAVLMRQSRRMYAAWDGEDEDAIEQAEMKLSYALGITSVNLIIGFLFFGLGMYAVDFAQIHQTAVIINLLVTFAGYIYSMIVNIVLQKELVNFTKEINPEKHGSVYDLKFHQTWMENCDESEKLRTYQAGFEAMRTTGYVCMGLCIVCFIGMLSWDFGIVPMLMVLAVWLVMVVRYHAVGIRLSKKNSGDSSK